MNQATYLSAVDKARLAARDAADRQCVADVCRYCRDGNRPLPLADHEGWWHQFGYGEWGQRPCRASGIHERRAREREMNCG